MSDNSANKLVVELGEIQQSMLVAAYLRAQETRRPDRLVNDQKALEIVERVDFDFDRLKTPLSLQLDSALRAELLDELVGEFLQRHPAGIIVNLGSGLDGRFWRIDNGRVRWFDVDMPDSLVVRRKFYEEGPRNRFITSSMFDEHWINELQRQPDEPVLLIAEAVFVFFPEAKLQELFRMLAERLPGAELLFWSVGPGSRKQIRRRGVSQVMLPEFLWEIESGASVTNWDTRIRFVAEYPLIDRHPERWPIPRWVLRFPTLARRLRAALKITHVRMANPGEAPGPVPQEAQPRPTTTQRLVRAFDQAGFLIGFLTSMAAAGQGVLWLGPLAVLLVVTVRLLRDDDRAGAVKLITLVTLCGIGIDNVLGASGVMRYNHLVGGIGLCPLWAIFLWINLSAKLTNLSPRIQGRYGLAASVGGFLTPLAYIVGQKFGAVELGEGALKTRLILFIFGMLLMPACLWLSTRLHTQSR